VASVVSVAKQLLAYFAVPESVARPGFRIESGMTIGGASRHPTWFFFVGNPGTPYQFPLGTSYSPIMDGLRLVQRSEIRPEHKFIRRSLIRGASLVGIVAGPGEAGKKDRPLYTSYFSGSVVREAFPAAKNRQRQRKGSGITRSHGEKRKSVRDRSSWLCAFV